MDRALLLLMVSIVAFSVSCSGKYESLLRRDIESRQNNYPIAPDSSVAPVADLEEGEPAYVGQALRDNPEIRAAFERWQANVLLISRARRLPEPTLSFGYFVQSLETRLGPQQGRVSLQQAFPWPTKLTAGADAASARALAAQRRFEAQALVVKQRVAEAYWNLWQVRRTRHIHREHLDILRGLSQTILARVATGSASLAEQLQVDLLVSRIGDSIQGMDEAERSAEARLRAAVGIQGELAVPTMRPPPKASLPEESSQVLADLARNHPMIESLGFLAEAHDSMARTEFADRLPGFTVGVDWIIVGDGAMAGTPDSGKDAIMVGLGIRLPIWQNSYADSIAAAQSEARAQRAEQLASANRALDELESALANVRDSFRRIGLYEGVLIPQAESAYASILGLYASGKGMIAQLLLAQRDLIELRVEFEKSLADHARAWARLEQIAGRELGRVFSGG